MWARRRRSERPSSWPRSIKIVLPTHRLSGPYVMPTVQQRPARESSGPKWTAKRVAIAKAEIAAGREVQPIKRAKCIPAEGANPSEDAGPSQHGGPSEDVNMSDAAVDSDSD